MSDVRIAETSFRYNKGTVLYNRDERTFTIIVDKIKSGPYTKEQLEVMDHVIKDVLDMRGRYGAI